MKTNYYILLLLLLSFSFANAQANNVKVETETNKTISVSEVDDNVTTVVDSTLNNVVENEDLLFDDSEIKETIARGTSDIKIYLNRLRNVENISILFPKLNKVAKA